MTTSVLDDETISELKLIMEDDLSALVDSYIENSAELIQQLSAGADGADADTFILRIHSLKGSCRNIGALPMAQQCEEIEKLARAGQFAEVPQRLDHLNAAFDEVRTALSTV